MQIYCGLYNGLLFSVYVGRYLTTIRITPKLNRFPCRLLSTGMTQKAISHSFGVAQPTVQKILVETVRAIFKALKAEYIGTPSEERRQTNAQIFEQR